MGSYRDFHRRSIDDREGFLGRAGEAGPLAQAVRQVLDYSRPPFAKWFVGGGTNLCYNAVDRHLAARGEQKALVYISTERDEERSYTYASCTRRCSARRR